MIRRNLYSRALTALIFILCIFLPRSFVYAEGISGLPSFSEFYASVVDGRVNAVVGVYVPGILALKVVQQPADDPGSVIQQDGVATQFRSAAQFNVIGLLAHNNLAGSAFSSLKIGQIVRIIYGNGWVDDFVVNWLASYQALQPDRQDGNYVDLSSRETYSAREIFSKFYTGNIHVTFQTCILNSGNASWGRLFITAFPLFKLNIRDFHPFKFEQGWRFEM
jgi:hypothetical protein